MTTTDNGAHLVELSGEDASDAGVGGKAAALAVMGAAGLPVPPAVVVPAHAADSDIDRLAAQIADRFDGVDLAVRSSGISEDLAEASFAGQYDTVLGVPSRVDAIATAILRVRASSVSGGVASYAGARPVGMAVLVMPMLEPDAAGIAFTRDPVDGTDVTVVEAVAGLGDRLAAGEVSGERWRVGADARREADLGVLTADQAMAVAELARRCETVAGRPQDIEWAMVDGRAVLLQSRAITTGADVEPIPMDDTAPPGPWEWDSTHNRRPMTPLTVSVFAEAFERASRQMADTYGAPIKQLRMRAINGYIYIQVVPPAGKPGGSPPPKAVMRLLFKVVPSLRRRVRAARLAHESGVGARLVGEWRSTVEPRIAATIDSWHDADRTTLSDDELASLFDSAVELERETFGWNMLTDFSYLTPLADLEQFVRTELGGDLATVVRLLAGSSPSPYAAATARLAAEMPDDVRAAVIAGADRRDVEALSPEFSTALRAHLRAYGDRILGFDLSNPTLLETASLELSRIATQPQLRDPSAAAAELSESLRGRLDEDARRRFDELLSEARETYPIREESELTHARSVGILRLIALDIGSRMHAAGSIRSREHIVFLTVDEVLRWLRSPWDVTSTVERRRGEHAWALGHSPMPFIGGRESLPPIDLFPPEIQRVMRGIQLVVTHDQRPGDLADGADGVPASPGVYTGPVRLVEGPEEFARVQAGDVLVAPLTTSPWEILFPHIGALVTEGGGLLSHPAIVAREYGLPAVVGCEGAMTRFTDGQVVRVDGAAGTVTPIAEI